MMKKTIITIFIILFLISIYKDLSFGTDISTKEIQQENQIKIVDNPSYEVIKVKMEPGDTVLTVVERLNPTRKNLNIESVIQDFTSLNPNVKPNELQHNRFYFFPKYLP
jgi:hypothetical protein